LRGRDAGGDVPKLVLNWRETGGPPVAEPDRRGVGSRLIRMGLAGTRDASLRFLPLGFEAQFRAPLRLLAED
jgi:two-component sensor histidine kinase